MHFGFALDSWNIDLWDIDLLDTDLDLLVGHAQPIFQRRINVVSTLWINVGPTLKMKQNPTSDFQRRTTLIQRQCCNNVETTLHNVETTLHVVLRWCNVDTTLFQPSVRR